MRDRFLLVTAALVFSLGFLAMDTIKSLQLVRYLSELETSAVESSSTSETVSRHRLILPGGGPDGYHWIMQTERMLADGSLRIRHVDYDNAPGGRAVHWSSALRWWVGFLAVAHHRVHPEMTASQSVARVAPWAMALALGLSLAVLTVVIARALGAVAGALFAVAPVFVLPSYALWFAGVLDHHGLVALSALLLVLCLSAGGAGWVAAEAGVVRATARPRVGPPDNRAARRWMIAAGVAAGVGLWLSAATMVPVMIGVGVSALVSTGLLAREPRGNAAAGPAPELWRVWGFAAGATSLLFYLVEYFPHHAGWRLEVNHPLYTLALIGAGDLLCRLSRLIGRGARVELRRAWLWLDVAAIAALPLVIMAAPATFRVGDAFLWALHADYIDEFANFGRLLSVLPAAELLQLVLPVVLLPLAGVLWHTTLTGAALWVWRTLLVLLLGAALVLLHGLVFHLLRRALGAGAPALLPLSVIALAAIVCVLVWLPARWRIVLPVPVRATLLLAAAPAAVLLALAIAQQRWAGTAYTLLLAPLVAAGAWLHTSNGSGWSSGRRVPAVALLVLVLLPFPATAVLRSWRSGYHDPAVQQIVARDVAHTLRARLGNAAGVVLSGPTTTSLLIYFGGLRGVGTLYWENLDGLKAAAAIYAARTDHEARALLARHGVTHIVIDSNEPFVEEYVRLAHGQRRDTAAPAPDAFIFRVFDPATRPAWLKEVPYTVPAAAGDVRLLILEVKQNHR